LGRSFTCKCNYVTKFVYLLPQKKCFCLFFGNNDGIYVKVGVRVMIRVRARARDRFKNLATIWYPPKKKFGNNNTCISFTSQISVYYDTNMTMKKVQMRLICCT
jgi:hypothetical protein